MKRPRRHSRYKTDMTNRTHFAKFARPVVADGREYASKLNHNGMNPKNLI